MILSILKEFWELGSAVCLSHEFILTCPTLWNGWKINSLDKIFHSHKFVFTVGSFTLRGFARDVLSWWCFLCLLWSHILRPFSM